jgi:phosphoribosylaminoimidazolecarboxamide formyltransferase/IMP cyclohydrolase
MNKDIQIQRALVSVSDKTGVVALAETLKRANCEIISTGGTKKVLEAAGIDVIDISEITHNPEAFEGRMKTISFQVESALLFDREKDAEEAAFLEIQPIDMVVCNLYPFEAVKNQGADFDTLIENIDIGGPTMIRAAAKNFKYVSVITDPADYLPVIAELEESNGTICYDTRFELMRKAFNATADYDAIIATTMDETVGKLSVRLNYSQAKELRYGENSHQAAYFLRKNDAENSFYDMEVLAGKELSFNNMVDMFSALDAVKDLENEGCAIIKHNNPCGLCQGKKQEEVVEAAWAGDPVSAFGSVIAFNRKVTFNTVKFFELDNENIMLRKFVEVVAAPSFENEAVEYLQNNKNLRVVEIDPSKIKIDYDVKVLPNALLYQNSDDKLFDKAEWVTEKQGEMDEELLKFGMIAVRQIKSNAIVIVRKTNGGLLQLLGMGSGQPNRINSTNLAINRAKENLKLEYNGAEEKLNEYIETEMAKTVLVSDAFFPFPDNAELAAAEGIKTLVQPGGSIRDKSVIKTCNELGLSMMFTGTRHFKH